MKNDKLILFLLMLPILIFSQNTATDTLKTNIEESFDYKNIMTVILEKEMF